MTPPAPAARAASSRRTAERGAIERRRPSTLPPRPRRVSGPDRGPARGRPARGRPSAPTRTLLGLLASLEGLSPRLALDRLGKRRSPASARADTVGRVWIGFVAFALIGIVTLQLGLLKLNAGIGRALEHTALLQRENAALSVENSEMAASHHVQEWAARMGMGLAPVSAIRFLNARSGSDWTRGAAALVTPLSSTAKRLGEASASSHSAEASTTTSTTATSSPAASAEAPETGEARPSAVAPSPAAGGPSGGSATSSSESSTGSANTPSATPGAGSGSAEGAPAGGTRPGPSG